MGRVMGLLMMLGLVTGCDVARGAVFIATVKHYHGEPLAQDAPVRESQLRETVAEQSSGTPKVSLPPRVKK